MRRHKKKDLVEPIEGMILTVRGEKVILDTHLARLYGVETGALNRAVKRNRGRFPADFLFRLTKSETESLICQFGISKRGRGGRRFLPYAFTEHGAIMAANVLNSRRAAQMSVYVVRAFLKMRRAFSDTRELARKLETLERELKARLDVHEVAIVEVLRRVMDILDPPPQPAAKPGQIGFHVKQDSA
jgi:hypothetical protein